MRNLLFLVLLFSKFCFGQVDPISWSFDADLIGEDKYTIKAVVEIEEGWYMYSQIKKDPESNIIPTSFYFELDDAEGIEFIDARIEKWSGYPLQGEI